MGVGVALASPLESNLMDSPAGLLLIRIGVEMGTTPVSVAIKQSNNFPVEAGRCHVHSLREIVSYLLPGMSLLHRRATIGRLYPLWVDVR